MVRFFRAESKIGLRRSPERPSKLSVGEQRRANIFAARGKRWCWPLSLLLAFGCAVRPGVPTTPAVVVTALALGFPERDRGELAFTLRLPNGSRPATEVSWELFLDGQRFAAGIDGDLPADKGLVHVKAALASKHLAWREGDGWLDVVLEGEVDLGDSGERRRFRDRRELFVNGRPLLNAPRDLGE